MDERYLTVAEVSAFLQVHPESVTRWIRRGELAATLLSRRAGYRILQADLDAFLQSKRRTPPPDRFTGQKLPGS